MGIVESLGFSKQGSQKNNSYNKENKEEKPVTEKSAGRGGKLHEKSSRGFPTGSRRRKHESISQSMVR